MQNVFMKVGPIVLGLSLLANAYLGFADNHTTAAVPVLDNSALKVGIVDMRTIMQKAPQVEVINKGLEKEFKPRENEIIASQKQLKADIDKLNRDGSVMSDSNREQLQAKIISEKASAQALITSFKQDLSNAQNQATQKFLNQVAEIVGKISKNKQYDLILQGENVPYFNPKLNITDEVLAGLKK